MPKGVPIKYTCQLCSKNFNGTGKFIKHITTQHNITPETYRYNYFEGHLGTPKCIYCGEEIRNKSVPFRDSLEFCNNCRSLVRSERMSDQTSRLWKLGVFKDKWKELSEGSHDPDFMYAKLASRVNVDKPCTFYFVKDSKCVKVGFTFDFNNRVKDLPKTIVKLVEFNNSYNCIKSECEFHDYFKNKCITINGKTSEYYPIELESDLLTKFDELVSRYNV